ncbi:MAG: AIR synthase family protein [Dehalococcoidia bacterium]|nr:AIR synthase family protein [Dehalococcoidia bacterium]
MEPLKLGKLPPELLRRLLSRLPLDPRVLIGPGIGEDAAVISMGDRLLVAKTDPVTFATEDIGWYAVQVNANDIAVMGGEPRWFLATALLPEGATSGLAESIFIQIEAACTSLGISLVGGHTEVTQGLDRPILVGCMLGEATPETLLPTSGAKLGDDIILTKGIAIEGTATLALEYGPFLSTRGVDPELIRRATRFLYDPGISVVKDALTARRAAPVHAMHDPTEGGLSTGLYELAQASGLGLEIDTSQITVFQETQTICDWLGLSPLGLLASGALILASPESSSVPIIEALDQAGIPARVIGRLVEREKGFRTVGPGGEGFLPAFIRDELARWLDERASKSQGANN